MKTLGYLYCSLMALCISLGIGSATMAAETFDVASGNSKAMFKVSNFYVSHVSGEFTDISGTIVVNREDTNVSSVTISIKPTSVDTHIKKRDNHLRSADFFNVEKYPEMGFKSKRVEKIKDDVFRVTGDFSLLGVTKSITVDVKKTGEGKDKQSIYYIRFETNFNINRSDYGMTYDSSVIGDKVAITLKIEAARK